VARPIRRRELARPGRPLPQDPQLPERALPSQQNRFDSFRNIYNNERPHEALNQRTPGSFYRSSSRAFPTRLPPVAYPAHFEVRKVSTAGGIRWKNRYFNVTTVLIDEYVGPEEVDDGLWTLYYSDTELGRFDERTYRITDTEGEDYRKPHQSRHPKPEPHL
jgi:hypothetical protein